MYRKHAIPPSPQMSRILSSILQRHHIATHYHPQRRQQQQQAQLFLSTTTANNNNNSSNNKTRGRILSSRQLSSALVPAEHTHATTTSSSSTTTTTSTPFTISPSLPSIPVGFTLHPPSATTISSSSFDTQQLLELKQKQKEKKRKSRRRIAQPVVSTMTGWNHGSNGVKVVVNGRAAAAGEMMLEEAPLSSEEEEGGGEKDLAFVSSAALAQQQDNHDDDDDNNNNNNNMKKEQQVTFPLPKEEEASVASSSSLSINISNLQTKLNQVETQLKQTLHYPKQRHHHYHQNSKKPNPYKAYALFQDYTNLSLQIQHLLKEQDDTKKKKPLLHPNVVNKLMDALLPTHFINAYNVLQYYIEHFSPPDSSSTSSTTNNNDDDDVDNKQQQLLNMYIRFTNAIGYTPSSNILHNISPPQQRQRQKQQQEKDYEQILIDFHSHIINTLSTNYQCVILPRLMLSLVRHAMNPKVTSTTATPYHHQNDKEEEEEEEMEKNSARFVVVRDVFARGLSLDVLHDLSLLSKKLRNKTEEEEKKEEDDGRIDFRIYEKILEVSNYQKSGAWPFHRILKILVANGYQPEPSTVLNLLHNEHPFTEIKRTCDILRCIVQLDQLSSSSSSFTTTTTTHVPFSNQYDYYNTTTETINSIYHPQKENVVEEEQDTTTTTTQKSYDYQIDLGTIETMSRSAAISAQYQSKLYRKNYHSRHHYNSNNKQYKNDIPASKLILEIWNVLEYFYPNVKPTEQMYEDAIICFVNEYKQDQNVFGILHDMECGGGYVPKRGLIDGVAKCLCTSPGRVDNAYYILTNRTPGTSVTTSSMNCILGACAKLGLVDRAFATYEDFEAYDLVPNESTFSFLMECLAVDIMNRKSGGRKTDRGYSNDDDDDDDEKTAQSLSEEDMLYQLDGAEEVFSLMRDNGVLMTHHILRHYIQILCAVNDFDAARSVLEDAIEKHGDRVCIDSIALVSESFAYLGDFDAAEDVAALAIKSGYGCVPLYLTKSIERMKRVHSLNEGE